MARTDSPDGFGPGLPHLAYLDALAGGAETGWWDEQGIPAPWPDDFCDPASGWQLAGGEVANTDPKQPF